MTNCVLDTIKRRRSIRAYRPEQIEEAEVCAIAEAGQFAPCGGGEAWHFTVVQNSRMLERINVLAKAYAATSGLPWLERLGRDESFHSMYHAPTAVFVSGEEAGVCAVSDTAAATQNMLLAACSLGIGSCWGYFPTQAFRGAQGEALRRELQIPDGYTVYTCVMLGYPAEEKAAQPRRPGTLTFLR